VKRKPSQRAPDAGDDPASLRRRAETSLANRKGKTAPPPPRVDTVRLLNELEIHRLELEMQNAELRNARDALETALETYTDLYDFAPVGYFSIDETGVILEANLTGAALLGAERGRIVGRKIQRFVAPMTQPAFDAFLGRLLERPEKQSCELSMTGPGDAVIWAGMHGSRATSPRDGRRWCRLAVSDITALKRADEERLRMEALAARNRELNLEIARRHKVEQALRESDEQQTRLLDQARAMQEQLRRLSRGILHAQEEERKRISRELHDVVGQAAVGINLHLEVLSRESAGKSQVRRSRIAKTKELLADLVEVVHEFSRELRPPMLDDLGLAPALKSLAKDFSLRTGIDVVLTSSAATERLPNATTTVLYRVAQEALTNVAKHARASRAEIRFEESPGIVRMEVADDGRAFEVKRVLVGRRNRRLGLLGMRERVEMVGGVFSVESSPGEGTRVRADVPLDAAGVPVAPRPASAFHPGAHRVPPARAKRSRAAR
jgi:PAS domain S-box-containing protein